MARKGFAVGAGFKKYLTMICLGGALVATPALAASHHGERHRGQEPNITRPGPSKGWGSYRAPQQTQPAPQFQAQHVQNNNNRRGARRGNDRGNYSNRGNTNRTYRGYANRGNANRSNHSYRGNTNRTYRGDANRTYRSNFNRGNVGNSSHWRGRGNVQNRAAHRGNRHYRFSHRNYSRFNTHERTLWRSGRWHHGRHHGRNGWWWTLGGAWYFYNQPIYPYPGYVSSYYYSDPYYDTYNSDPYYGSYLPYAGDVPSADVDSVGGPPPDDDQYWYYCRDPKGYYPYVRECRGRWEPVEPTPYGNDDDGE